MHVIVTVCETCNFSSEAKLQLDRTGGEMLAELLEQDARSDQQVQVRRHACLMGCARHCNVALSAAGKLTYVLGSFEPAPESAAAIMGFARLYAESATGQVPYRLWPEGVKGHFVARIPPLPAA